MAIKMLHLIVKHNPNLSTFRKINAFDSTLMTHLDEDLDFNIAFGIQGYYTRENLANPDFIRFEALYQEKVNDERQEDISLDIDLCT